jgi:hypothetical protein
MPDRGLRWRLLVGTAYAVLVRGFLAMMALLPGLGYSPFLARTIDSSWVATVGRINLMVEVAVDVALPVLAVYWAIAGFKRRSPRATRRFGFVLLADNVIYIGSMALVPAETSAGLIGQVAAMALVQLPLIALSIQIVARSRPRARLRETGYIPDLTEIAWARRYGVGH